MDYLEFQELYHTGVKGMKWGYRKFTNEDGTLTEAGKKRYGQINEKGTLDARGKRQLKIDQRAIKGQRLYENGTSLIDVHNRQKNINTALTIAAIGGVTVGRMIVESKPILSSGEAKAVNIIQGALGAIAVGAIVNNVTARVQRKNLQAYSINGPKQYHKIKS